MRALLMIAAATLVAGPAMAKPKYTYDGKNHYASYAECKRAKDRAKKRGAVIGAVAGGVGTAVLGGNTGGSLLGAGVGALGGAVIGNETKKC